MKLTINRSTWQRGQGAGTFLSSAGGTRQQCAVGQYLSAIGVEDNVMSPSLYASLLPDQAAWLHTRHMVEHPNGQTIAMMRQSELALEIFRTNDAPLAASAWTERTRHYVELGIPLPRSDAEREARLVELFAKADVELEFVNGAPVALEPRATFEFTMVDEAMMLDASEALVVPKMTPKLASAIKHVLASSPGKLQGLEVVTYPNQSGGGYKLSWLEK